MMLYIYFKFIALVSFYNSKSYKEISPCEQIKIPKVYCKYVILPLFDVKEFDHVA